MSDNTAAYQTLQAQLRGLIADQTDFLSNTANFAALLFNSLPQLNWTGFYLLRGQELLVGPFQGKPACSRIAIGKGVCGTAALRRTTIVVPDVDAFPGHIACDGASRSEIVVPLFKDARLIGVLDLDSPVLDRFDDCDREHLEKLLQVLMEGTVVPDYLLT